MSIQAGETAHSTPQESNLPIGSYSHVEIGVLVDDEFLEEEDAKWLEPWADCSDGHVGLLAYVPADRAVELYNLMIDMFGEPTLTYK